jgi:CRISPR/Cas system-associated endoribonuclease Cas2
MFVVVFYDVPAKRTALYRKLLARYLPWIQNSSSRTALNCLNFNVLHFWFSQR